MGVPSNASLDGWPQRYEKLLTTHAEHPDDLWLHDAALLGKALGQHRIPIEDIAAAHASACANLVQPGRDVSQCLTETGRLHHRLMTAYEAVLRERDQHIKALNDCAEDIIFVVDRDDRLEYVNNAAAAALNHSPHEMIGARRADFFSPLDAASQQRELRSVFESSEPLRKLERFHMDGEDLWLATWLTPIRREDGTVRAVMGIARDVTELRQTQEALRGSETRYRDLFDGVPIGLYRTTADGRFLDVNAGLVRILGYPDQATLLSEPVPNIYARPEDRQAYLAELEQHGGAHTAELELRRLDGSRIWGRLSAHIVRGPDGRVLFYEGSLENVTKRRRAEEELRRQREHLEELVERRTRELADANRQIKAELAEHRSIAQALRDSEERFRQVTENIREAFWLSEPDTGRPLYLSPACEQIWGGTPEQLTEHPETWLEHIHPDDQERIRDDVKRQALGHATDHEYRLVQADGTVRWVRARAFPIRDKAGKVYRVAGIAEDTTERKQVEQTLRSEREFSTRIIMRSPAIITAVAPDGTTKFINPSGEQITGYRNEELVGRNWWTVFYLGDEQRQVPQLYRAFKKGDVRDYEMELTTRTGAKRTIAWSSINRHDEHGKLTEIVGIGTDVTEQKRRNALLQIQRDISDSLGYGSDLAETMDRLLSEALRLADLDCGGIYLVDPSTGALDLTCHRNLSPEFVAKVAHYDADSPPAHIVQAGRPVYDQPPTPGPAEVCQPEGLRGIALVPVHHDGRAVACLNLASRSQESIPQDVRHVLEAVANRVGGVIARIRATTAVRESEELSRAVIEASKDAMVAIDHTGRISVFNPAAERMFGREREAMLGEPLDLLMPMANREEHRRFVESFLATGQSRGAIGKTRELSALRESGDEFPIELSLSVARSTGKPLVLALIRDITEHKQAEKDLRKFKSISDQAAYGAAIADLNGNLVYANDAFARMHGRTAREIVGQHVRLLHSDEQRPRVQDLIHRLNHEGSFVGEEVWHMGANGVAFPTQMNGTIVRDEHGAPLFLSLTAVDITEQKQAEAAARQHRDELAHVARVSTLGEMASGLAHELAQPISAILYYAKGCSSRLTSGSWGVEEAGTAVLRIAAQAERAGDFIRNLKSFVRRTEPHRIHANINRIVNETLGLAAPEMRQNDVSIDLSLEETLPRVVVDEIQIEQVILNLLRNAVEALDKTPPHQRQLSIHSEPGPDDTVRVTVRDNGPGFSEEDASRIFDPFFTTKTAGTGLGLSISRSIIEAHDGKLWATREPTGDTALTFTLPIAREADHEHE